MSSRNPKDAMRDEARALVAQQGLTPDSLVEFLEIGFRHGTEWKAAEVQLPITLLETGCKSIEQLEEMNQVEGVERNDIAFAMKRFGDCFERSLAVAIKHANADQAIAIKRALPSIWIKFANFYKERLS